MKILDQILNNQKISTITKSINALHIVKIHSAYTKRQIGFFAIINKLIKKILSFFITILNILINNFIPEEKFPKAKILIISHFVNHDYLNSNNDFYFGNFEKLLKAYNYSSCKIMINHTDYSSYYLRKRKKKKNIFFLNKKLNFFNELKILLSQVFSIIELMLLLFKKEINFNYFLNLSLSLFDSSTSFSLRMNFQIRDIVKKVKPKYCILTYEGYSWERSTINAIKSVNPDIKCIGYQHTSLTSNHNSIFKTLKGNFNPDQIWCSQLKSFKLLNKKIRKNKIYLIGSFKKIPKTRSKIINNKILVIPEGIYSECEKLFNLCLKIALKNKNLLFIWRVHPVINIKKVLQNLKLKMSQLPRNIKISNKSFEYDINNTSIAIYRGSTAILKCFAMGNFPIYFDDQSEKNFDPLKDIVLKKNYISNEREFTAFLKKIKNKQLRNMIMNKIPNVIKNFFVKPNIRMIKLKLK